MQMQDDRTPEQVKTHPILVIGTDSFMSGWGKASDGPSYAAWAATLEDWPRVFKWVEGRSEMKRVRVVAGDYRPSARGGHCHIYVVDEDHPATRTLA